MTPGSNRPEAGAGGVCLPLFLLLATLVVAAGARGSEGTAESFRYFDDNTLPFTSRSTPDGGGVLPWHADSGSPRDERRDVSRRTPRDSNGEKTSVLEIRELTPAERAGLTGKLACSDALAAEIRPDRQLRLILQRELNMTEAHLPQTVVWIFGRQEQCFPRNGSTATKLNELDAELRRLAPQWLGY